MRPEESYKSDKNAAIWVIQSTLDGIFPDDKEACLAVLAELVADYSNNVANAMDIFDISIDVIDSII